MSSLIAILRCRRHHCNETGVTTVEAAVIFPVFLFLIAAAVSFAQIFYSRLLINDALRAAGRAAVLSSVRDISDSGGIGCEKAAEDRFHELMARAEISSGADAVAIYRESAAGKTPSDPPIAGIHIQPRDVQITCVLCPLLAISGVEYRPTTSQFVPFESTIHNCWDELPDF